MSKNALRSSAGSTCKCCVDRKQRRRHLELWVWDACQFERARTLLHEFRNPPNRHWPRLGCHEIIDEPFEQCWSCGAGMPTRRDRPYSRHLQNSEHASMISISREQMASLCESSNARSVQRLVLEVSELQSEYLGDHAQQTSAQIEICVRQAVELGLHSLTEIRLFALTGLVLGSDFATRLSWASAIIHDGLVEPGRRLFECAAILFELRETSHGG